MLLGAKIIKDPEHVIETCFKCVTTKKLHHSSYGQSSISHREGLDTVPEK